MGYHGLLSPNLSVSSRVSPREKPG